MMPPAAPPPTPMPEAIPACPACGVATPRGLKVCPACGSALPAVFHVAARFMAAIAQIRAGAENAIKSIPGYTNVESLCRFLTTPVRGLALGALKVIPALKKAEYFLETESLTRRNPILLMITLVPLFIMGASETRLGHIGTHPYIYKVMPAVGFFNPFLALVGGLVFGLGDLFQKILLKNDMYGASGAGISAAQYWGAIAGYCVGYSAVVLAGILPGIFSRLCRWPVDYTVRKSVERVMAHAQGGEVNAAADLIRLGAMMGGAYLGTRCVMYAAPTLESPAFNWRPHPDTSCLAAEVNYIKNQANAAGLAGAAGGPVLVSVMGPGLPPMAPPTLPPPESPPPTQPPPDDRVYDEEGYDQDGYDRAGFDRDGYDRSGYDHDGFDRGGFARDGYDRDGLDSEGYDRNGFNRSGFDRNGYDKNGFDLNGYDKDGFNKDGYSFEGYDRNGFNKDGFNREGLDKDGFNKDGLDPEGFGRDGFNKDGLDRDGFGRDGFNKDGLDRDGYDKNGLNRDGIDKDGFDKNGFNSNGFDRDGFNKDGLDKDGFDKGGFNKQGLDKDGFNKDGRDRWGFDRDGLNKDGKTKAEVMDDLWKRQRELEKESGKGVTASEVMKNFGENVKNEVAQLPGQLKDAAGAAYTGTKNVVKAVAKELTDVDNYKALGEAAKQTVTDLVTKPLDSAQKVGKFYGDVADTGKKIAEAVAKDPLKAAGMMLGADTWKKVIDPNVPLVSRIGNALYGAVDAGLNLAGAGLVGKAAKAADIAGDAAKVAKVADGALDAAKAAKVADQGADAARAAKVADKADDAGKAAKAADKGADAARPAKVADKADDAGKAAKAEAAAKPPPAPQPSVADRKKAFDEARDAGKAKVDELAEAVKTGDPDRIRKATLDVQRDKQALWEINRRDDALKTAMNNEVKEIKGIAKTGIQDDLAKKYGVKPEDVKFVEPTNPSKKVKVGADWDVTADVKVTLKEDKWIRNPQTGEMVKHRAGDVVTVEVPSRDLQKIANKNYHEASGAGKHYPGKSADDIAREADVVATDRLHAESYGRKRDDLDVALKHPEKAFSDPDQVGRAMAYKGHERFNEAHELQRAGKLAEAETALGEGMRQTTKQFQNQVVNRLDAVKAEGKALLENAGSLTDQQRKVAEAMANATVDPKLQKAVGIMENVEKKLCSPAEAEKLLKQMGMTPYDVATRSGEQIQRLQQMKGPL